MLLCKLSRYTMWNKNQDYGNYPIRPVMSVGLSVQTGQEVVLPCSYWNTVWWEWRNEGPSHLQLVRHICWRQNPIHISAGQQPDGWTSLNLRQAGGCLAARRQLAGAGVTAGFPPDLKTRAGGFVSMFISLLPLRIDICTVLDICVWGRVHE